MKVTPQQILEKVLVPEQAAALVALASRFKTPTTAWARRLKDQLKNQPDTEDAAQQMIDGAWSVFRAGWLK